MFACLILTFFLTLSALGSTRRGLNYSLLAKQQQTQLHARQTQTTTLKTILEDKRDTNDMLKQLFDGRLTTITPASVAAQSRVIRLTAGVIRQSLDHVPGILPLLPALPSAVRSAFKDALRSAVENDDDFTRLFDALVSREAARNKKEAARRRRLEAEVELSRGSGRSPLRSAMGRGGHEVRWRGKASGMIVMMSGVRQPLPPSGAVQYRWRRAGVPRDIDSIAQYYERIIDAQRSAINRLVVENHVLRQRRGQHNQSHVRVASPLPVAHHHRLGSVTASGVRVGRPTANNNNHNPHRRYRPALSPIPSNCMQEHDDNDDEHQEQQKQPGPHTPPQHINDTPDHHRTDPPQHPHGNNDNGDTPQHRGDECEGEREVSECVNGCRYHLRNHSRGVNYCPPSLKLTAKLRRRSNADGPLDFYPFFVKRHRPPSSSAPTHQQHQQQHHQHQHQQGASSDGRGRTGGEERGPRRMRERTAIDYREPKLTTKLRKGDHHTFG
ncbi:unnamed protein product [Vitrella brassicaformis CCMP3155]|uniref:Uncharacterized protein n=1 Tax=Vitrella brassicaformis (strain CCMP3155) TaxID=1169540 RepID=A0A0G4GNN0_VITBC|nr:unnamed protein product [Vitrella brassicaformis CCMP3155]|eukprot:CEM31908.1 unnamed protein product [Vitrella brassicaformis CCMP3155]